MPYVTRDNEGNIVKVSDKQSKKAQEELPPDDPDLCAFLASEQPSKDIQEKLASSDLEFVRVLEDVIAVLIDKRIIVLTDLPVAAQEKLARRYALRSRLTDLGGIVGETDELMLP